MRFLLLTFLGLTLASCDLLKNDEEESAEAVQAATTTSNTTDEGQDSSGDIESPNLNVSSDVSVEDVSTTSVEITWQPAEDNDTAAESLNYDIYISSESYTTTEEVKNSATEVVTDLQNVYTYEITGLNPSTTYQIYVIVRDSAGNDSLYNKQEATTAPPLNITNNMSAVQVLGQNNFTDVSANQGGSAAANTLNAVDGVAITDDRLAIADRGNNRVLLYDSIPTSNAPSADAVLGQTDFTSTGSGCTQNTFDSPRGVGLVGNRIFVAAGTQSRVLIWNNWPTTDGVNADTLVGQADFTTCINDDSSATNIADNRLSGWWALSLYATANQLFVADHGYGRVVAFDSPYTTNMSASLVLGSPDFDTKDYDATASITRNVPDVFSDGTMLCVPDMDNNRVLLYNTIPSTSAANADIVIGQSNFTNRNTNAGGSISNSALDQPHSCAYNGTYFAVADTDNHRVLVWQGLPTANQQPANFVIGQGDFTSGSANAGGSAQANTFNKPTMVRMTAEALYVVDQNNHRILVFK